MKKYVPSPNLKSSVYNCGPDCICCDDAPNVTNKVSNADVKVINNSFDDTFSFWLDIAILSVLLLSVFFL